jgi:hypothetical protein
MFHNLNPTNDSHKKVRRTQHVCLLAQTQVQSIYRLYLSQIVRMGNITAASGDALMHLKQVNK